MTLRTIINENEITLTKKELIDKKLKSVLKLIDFIQNSDKYKKDEKVIYDSLKSFIEDLFKRQQYEY